MCFSSPGDIRPFSSMHLRRRQGRTSWVIAHTGSGQQPAAEPGSVPPMTAICPGARHRMAGGLAACSGETTLTEHSGWPGPAVVGYLVKDGSPSGVRIPRLSDIVSLGSTTFIRPGSP